MIASLVALIVTLWLMGLLLLGAAANLIKAVYALVVEVRELSRWARDLSVATTLHAKSAERLADTMSSLRGQTAPVTTPGVRH